MPVVPFQALYSATLLAPGPLTSKSFKLSVKDHSASDPALRIYTEAPARLDSQDAEHFSLNIIEIFTDKLCFTCQIQKEVFEYLVLKKKKSLSHRETWHNHYREQFEYVYKTVSKKFIL